MSAPTCRSWRCSTSATKGCRPRGKSRSRLTTTAARASAACARWSSTACRMAPIRQPRPASCTCAGSKRATSSRSSRGARRRFRSSATWWSTAARLTVSSAREASCRWPRGTRRTPTRSRLPSTTLTWQWMPHSASDVARAWQRARTDRRCCSWVPRLASTCTCRRASRSGTGGCWPWWISTTEKVLARAPTIKSAKPFAPRRSRCG